MIQNPKTVRDEPSTEPSYVDALRRLREHFAAQSTNALFHATRVLVRPELEQPNDLSKDWDEFLEQPGFQHSHFRTSHPAPRAQHFCFYGSRDLVSQFTGLAQQVALVVPMAFFPRLSVNPKDWTAQYCRDQWLLGLYRFAYTRRDVLPVTRELQRNGEGTLDGVDRGFFDPLARAGGLDENERLGYETWRASFTNVGSPPPRYLYASLSLNVWMSSLITIDYIIEKWKSLFPGTYDHDFWEHPDALRPFEPISIEEPQGNGGYLEVSFDVDNREVTRVGFKKKVRLSPIRSKLFLTLLKAQPPPSDTTRWLSHGKKIKAKMSQGFIVKSHG